MELQNIHEFVVLARTCKYLEAANQLFIAQSTLSKHIQLMEKELGNYLFDRTTRSVVLSEFGRVFLNYASAIDQMWTNCTEELRRSTSVQKTINIGICAVVTFLDISSFLPSFRAEFPSYQINVVQHDPTTLRRLLYDGKLDMIMTTKIIPEDPGLDPTVFNVIPFSKERLAAVLPENHALARSGVLSIDQLFGNTFIGLGTDAGHDSNLGAPVIQVDRASLVMELVRKEIGVAIMPFMTAMSSKTDGVIIVPLDPSPLVEINLVIPKKREYSRILQSIIAFLEETKP